MILGAKAKAKLKNRLWRLNNLYFIQDKNGKCVRFKLTREQLELFEGEHDRNIVLKARQLGFTTLVCIIQLDLALFHRKNCALIAHSLPDAERLFRNKVKFAYDRLPDAIKRANPLEKITTSEIVFLKGGSVTVSTSFRGGTLYSLHVSEFGKICARYPHKAVEIVTGAFEAVPLGGRITLESTAEGREGYFYDYCIQAEQDQIANKVLSSLDWKFFFFAWFRDPAYILPEKEFRPLPLRLIEYFDNLEQSLGVKLSEGHRQWYSAKERTLGDKIKREYPSFPAEAFNSGDDGCYYSKIINSAYAEGRIVATLPDNSHLPVMTFWDLGVSDYTTIWFIRKIGPKRYQIIDYYQNSGEGLRHYFKVLRDKGYRYSDHYAPHDIKNRSLENDAKSRLEIASEGYEIEGELISIDFQVVPSMGVNDGIELVRELLNFCEFDETKCKEGLSCLSKYAKAWNEMQGCWSDKPKHDQWSHGADAFRMFAVAMDGIKALADLSDITVFGY